MPNGKINLIDYCEGVVNDSPDYQGHDQKWSPPDSWRYTLQFQLVQARQRITDAMSMRHKGGDLQAIEYVAQHTFGVTLVANDIKNYRIRIILRPKERDGKRKPLLDPSGTSKHPKSRLIGMLPAVARTVITQFDHFDELLQQAVHLLPATVFTEGSPAKVELKRRLSSLEAVAHDLFEENQDLQESLEGEAKKRAREVMKTLLTKKNIQKNLTSIPLGDAARGINKEAHCNGSETSVCHEVK